MIAAVQNHVQAQDPQETGIELDSRFPRLEMGFLSQKHPNRRPVFAIFKFGKRMCRVGDMIDPLFALSALCFGRGLGAAILLGLLSTLPWFTLSMAIPSVGLSLLSFLAAILSFKFRGPYLRLRSEANLFLEEFQIPGGHGFETRMKGQIPEEVKGSVKEVREEFDGVAILLETDPTGWHDVDPIVFGHKVVDGRRICWYITVFDLLPKERYVKEEMAAKP